MSVAVRKQLENVAVLMAIMAFLAACGKEQPALKGKVSDIPVVPLVESKAMTKAGGEQVLDNLKSEGFSMEIIADEDYEEGTAGKYGDTRTVSFTDGKWVISPEAFWVNDIGMSFWTYNKTVETSCVLNSPEAGASGMTLSYPKPGVIPDGDTDLLFAYAGKSHNSTDKHASGSEGDMISLNFKHAMSMFYFNTTVGGLSTLDGYSVSEVSFNGLKTGGDISFNKTGFAWSNLSGDSVFAVDDLNKSVIVVPQNTRTASLQIKLVHGTKPTILLSASLPDSNLEAGKKYQCNLQIADGRELTVSMNILPWDLESRPLEIKEAAVNTLLTYSGGTIDSGESRIFIKNGMPVNGSFQLASPKGAKILLALDGNLDAFEVSPRISYVGNGPINFTITPLVDDPKVDYKTSLHIYLVNPDSSVSVLDEQLMREGGAYKHYTIVLPRQ